jgi:hypothetical protein
VSSRLTLENRLILACARTDPDVDHIRELMGYAPDWQEILRKTERWGVSSLVYASLRQVGAASDMPRPVAESLRHVHHRDTILGVAKREVLRATLRHFSAASVPVIVLKGAALAALVYPSPTLRPLGAIHLLVHEPDLDVAAGLLRDMTHTRQSIPYLGSGGFALVDIRHDIHGSGRSARRRFRAAVHIPVEDLWTRARSAEIESTATLVLGNEDLLLHLALWLIDQLSEPEQFDGQLRTVCDIAATCRRYEHAIDWSSLERWAKAYNARSELFQSLRLAHDLAGARLPSSVMTHLTSDADQLALEERLLSEHHAPGPRPNLAASEPRSPGDLRTLSEGTARPRATGARPTRVVPDVAVTYDQGGTDGVGSQLARVYGLYALSRAFRIKYVHTPIGEVRYQGLMPMLTGSLDPDFEARYNAFFALPSDDFDLEGCEKVRAHSLTEDRLARHLEHAAATGRPLLLQAHDAYGYLDRHPAAYDAVHAVTPYRDYQAVGPVRVCLHLRRGDMLNDGRSRWLPNSYFLRACGPVIEALREQDAAFVVRLHSEVPPRPYTLYPDHPGLYIALERPTTIDPAQYALEDFEALPNLEMVLNVEPQRALDDFATADVLIPARSDLGFLGGLLNTHSLVVGVPSYHTPPSDWLVADERGNLDDGVVSARIADLLRRRPKVAGEPPAGLPRP